MQVAAEGERATPKVPAPAALRPVLAFSRLSAAAYATIQRVVDDDGIFRARVAEHADEDEVGRAGWLWLHRPVDWAEDPAFSASPSGAPPRAKKDRSDARAAEVARLKRAAADAEAARRRAAEQAGEARRAAAAASTERVDLAARLEVALDERNAAVRRSKELEADLANARRDLKVARAAAREAEEELIGLRAGRPAPGDAPDGARGASPAPVEGGDASASSVGTADRWDRAATASAVVAASEAADALARSLAEAAASLAPAEPPPVPTPAVAPATGGSAPRRSRRRRPARRAPALPPGSLDGTVDAWRHQLRDPANVVVVDGYNVARCAWSGLAMEEERRRTVALLEEVQARSGGRVLVVFDGADDVVAPVASTKVQVRYSSSGQTADDLIARLVAELDPVAPVLVVSSDREVAADARRQGAVAIGSSDFLTAAGR